METEDRLVIPAPLGALFFPLVLIGLAAAAIYFGVKTLPLVNDSPEYAALIPMGLLLIIAGYFLYRSSSRPLVLDKKTDRVDGCREPLSSVQKVVVTDIGSSDSPGYAVELVFPTGKHRLSRWGWGYFQQSSDADHLAKKVAKFLNVPVETDMPFTVRFSFKKGLYMTEADAKEAEKAGYKIDPKAIK